MRLLIHSLLASLFIALGISSTAQAQVKPQADVGMAILALLNEDFPVQDAADVLQESNHPIFSFVYGTFGKDPQHYYDLMSKLLEAQKKPRTLIYGLCGPCRKPRRDGRMETFYPTYNVPQLNKAILKSPIVRKKYEDLITKIKQEFMDAYPDEEFIFIPELEDNQTAESFKVLLSITKKVFRGYKNVKIMRNALGNRGYLSLPKEIHGNTSDLPSAIKTGDGISMDGSSFIFPGERDIKGFVSYSELKKLIQNAKKKKIMMFVWRASWQGIYNDHPPLPAKRKYKIDHKDLLIALMRL